MSFYLPATVGMPLAEVDTPALILELVSFERNLKRLQASLSKSHVALRPHAKSHKCPTIALQQIRRGAVGVCCQKVSEAEAMVAGGVTDILITNEVVGAIKIRRLIALAQRAQISVCADHPVNVADLNLAAQAAKIKLDVLVEINVGADRCGVAPGAAACDLAQRIHESSHLRFAGLQAYQGGAQHLRTTEARRQAIESACEKVRLTQQCLSLRGLPCPKVTGAGTGTYLFEAASDLYTEIQPGSYPFMDVDYARNDWTESAMPGFEHSLFVWTSVMSVTPPDRAIVDAGLKASSIDSGMPEIYGLSQARYCKASDEHGVIALSNGFSLNLGQKIKLIPGHCDPTVNLYDHFVCIRNDRVEALWPISARGALL